MHLREAWSRAAIVRVTPSNCRCLDMRNQETPDLAFAKVPVFAKWARAGSVRALSGVSPRVRPVP